MAQEAAEVADSVERMRATVRGHVSVVAESPNHMLVVFHQWRYLTGEHRARVLEKRRQYEDLFAELVSEGVQAGAFSATLDQRIAVVTLLGALNWSAEWLRADGQESTEQLGDRLADTVLQGLMAVA